jgi:hypothetical protein
MPAATFTKATGPVVDITAGKSGPCPVAHSKYVIFQLAEVAVPRPLFAPIPERIGRLRLAEASG